MCPSIENLIAYQKSVAITDRVVREDLIRRENHILSSCDQRMFWSYVNRRLSKDFIIDSINFDSNEIIDKGDIANIFNEYFASNFSPNHDVDLSADMNEFSFSDSGDLSFQFPPVTAGDVLKILNRLPSTSSTAVDGLSYRILKFGRFSLAHLLTDLFSVSLETAHIPSAWKLAIVTPIHKCGPKKYVKNYRPISVTSCCSRVLERWIRKQLADFLSKYNLIADSQHAFCPGKSTTTALLQFYDFITDKMDSNLIVDTVFFDFAKAFDKVPHSVLINRLYKHGICGNSLKWFLNFLTGRTQKVKIGTATSVSLPVSSRIIQGSVLGPILFTLFINKIDASLVYCSIVKYADDIRIFLSSKKDESSINDLQSKIQIDINNIVDWTSASRMSLNTEKCFVATFGRSNVSRDYSLYDTVLPKNSLFRDLGLSIGTPLSFNPHMNSIIAKAFLRLGLIHKVFYMKSSKSILHLYGSYVRPILEYSSDVWNTHSLGFIRKIERVQKRMCNMIPLLRHQPYRKQLEMLNILSLQARRLRSQLVLVYKIYCQLTKVQFDHFFTVVSNKN